MEYRELNEEYQPSLLGFGCMRFPLDAQGNINEAEAERMLDTAIAHGVKYIDTAFPYHHGDSEPFVGRVLKKYDRSSYYPVSYTHLAVREAASGVCKKGKRILQHWSCLLPAKWNGF